MRGRTVALTRPRAQAEDAADAVRRMGGNPYIIPTIEVKPARNLAPIKKLIMELSRGEVDYTIFVSSNGVNQLFAATDRLGQRSELLQGFSKTTVVAIGPSTAAALRKQEVSVNLIPDEYSSEGIAKRLIKLSVNGKTIRIPRTSESSPTLKRMLRRAGASVKEVHVYQSGIPNDEASALNFIKDIDAEKIHAVVFGSALSASNLFRMLKTHAPVDRLRALLNSRVTVVAIGPVTEKALTKLGVKVDVKPERYLFEDALNALAAYWNA